MSWLCKLLTSLPETKRSGATPNSQYKSHQTSRIFHDFETVPGDSNLHCQCVISRRDLFLIYMSVFSNRMPINIFLYLYEWRGAKIVTMHFPAAAGCQKCGQSDMGKLLVTDWSEIFFSPSLIFKDFKAWVWVSVFFFPPVDYGNLYHVISITPILLFYCSVFLEILLFCFFRYINLALFTPSL